MKRSRVVWLAVAIVLIVSSWSLPAQWPSSTGSFRCTIRGADDGRRGQLVAVDRERDLAGVGPPLLPIVLGIPAIAGTAFERLADVRTGRATGRIYGIGGAMFSGWILTLVFLLAG